MTTTRNPPAATRSTGRSQPSTRGAAVPARVLPPMSERNFQSAVLKLAAFHGYELRYHTHDSRRSAPGFPDLVLVSTRRGRVLFRELKTAAGRVSPEQKAWVEALAAAGQDAGVWRPAGLVDGSIVAELRQ